MDLIIVLLGFSEAISITEGSVLPFLLFSFFFSLLLQRATVPQSHIS